MSLSFVIPLVTKGYGLKDEDFDEIIEIERLRDLSKVLSGTIKTTQREFGSNIRIRIIEFNELSGANADSNKWFRTLIGAMRHMFYSHLHSNKDCCVLFKYAGYDMRKELVKKRTLLHEFAHHYQWATLGFPMFLPKGSVEVKEMNPQFTKCYGIGPSEANVYIDALLLDHNPISLIKDFSERISDFVCEGTLIEKGLKEGILEEYHKKRRHDPAKDYPALARHKFPVIMRYVRRLALFDAAEWHAILKHAYPNDQSFKKDMVYDKKHVIRLNKKYPKAKHAFRKIHEISLTTDYKSFKELKNAVNHIKQALNLLNIEIRTKEKW